MNHFVFSVLSALTLVSTTAFADPSADCGAPATTVAPTAMLAEASVKLPEDVISASERPGAIPPASEAKAPAAPKRSRVEDRLSRCLETTGDVLCHPATPGVSAFSMASRSPAPSVSAPRLSNSAGVSRHHV